MANRNQPIIKTTENIKIKKYELLTLSISAKMLIFTVDFKPNLYCYEKKNRCWQLENEQDIF